MNMASFRRELINLYAIDAKHITENIVILCLITSAKDSKFYDLLISPLISLHVILYRTEKCKDFID